MRTRNSSNVVGERCVAAHCAETRMGIGKAGGKSDTRPAANARQDRNILLSFVLVSRDVANDRKMGFEEKFRREEEFAFRLTALRNRLFGKWAASAA